MSNVEVRVIRDDAVQPGPHIFVIVQGVLQVAAVAGAPVDLQQLLLAVLRDGALEGLESSADHCSQGVVEPSERLTCWCKTLLIDIWPSPLNAGRGFMARARPRSWAEAEASTAARKEDTTAAAARARIAARS